jgi:hypothetical protein
VSGNQTPQRRRKLKTARAIRTLVCLLLLGLGLFAPPAAEARGPVASHAQLYSTSTPYPLKERIFAESKAMGASFIRLDVQMAPIFERNGVPGEPDWRGLDEVMRLSSAYALPVVGIILQTPHSISTCPDDPQSVGKCAATDPKRFGELSGQIAEHARGVIAHWEIINEPDGAWAFSGTPEQYGQMLSASYDEIHRRVPSAKVALGGMMSSSPSTWLRRALATAGAADRFDIANVHLRGRADDMPAMVDRWRRFFDSYGPVRPLWVTEHGYPSDTGWQDDAKFAGGESAQARYLNASLLKLADAGVEQVFVTLRDALDGRWASEGVVHIGSVTPFPVHRKQAFTAVQAFVGRWPHIPGWRAAQRWHSNQAAHQRTIAASQTALAVQARGTERRLRRRRSNHLRRARITGTRCRRLLRAGRIARARALCHSARRSRRKAGDLSRRLSRVRPAAARYESRAANTAHVAERHDGWVTGYERLITGET